MKHLKIQRDFEVEKREIEEAYVDVLIVPCTWSWAEGEGGSNSYLIWS